MKILFSIFLLAIFASFSFSTIHAEEYPLMISISPDGEPGNEDSFLPTLSSNGEHVVFMSRASNLVEDDRNHSMDIFVRDVVNKKTYLVSVTSDGSQKAHESNYPTISGDGNLVTFYTGANFDSKDVNEREDVYVHNIKTGETIWVSFPVSSSQTGENNQPKGGGNTPVISDDGKKIFFKSYAHDLGLKSEGNIFIFDMNSRTTSTTELIAGDFDVSGNGEKIVFTADRKIESFPESFGGDLFVYDVDSEELTWISKPVDEFNIQSSSNLGAMDFEGRFVVFRSGAPNLVEIDENNDESFFLHDLKTSKTKLISITPEGEEFFANSHPDISGDGKFVTFQDRGTLVYDVELDKTVELISFGGSEMRLNFDGSFVTSSEHRMGNSDYSQIFVTTNPPPDVILREQAAIEAEREADERELAEKAAADEAEKAAAEKAAADEAEKAAADAVEKALAEKKSKIASFVDATKDPKSYVDRYNNEPTYKEWFDENYPYYDSIEQAVGVKESTMEFVPEPTKEQTISDVDSEPTCGTGTESVNGICQVIKSEPTCGTGTHEENGICKLDSQKPKSEGFLDSLIKMFSSWFG